MDAQGHWDRVYHAKAPNEVSWYQANPQLSLDLIRATGLPLSGSVLDVGGGASSLVDRLVEIGYGRIGVLDLASAALEVSQARLGKAADRVEWFVADVRTFESPHPWDVWHDRAVLHFLTTPEDRLAYRRTMLGSLAPGGHAIISSFSLEGPPRCSGLPVQRCCADDLVAEFGDAMTLVEDRIETHHTPAGASQEFIYCRFRRS